MNIQNLSSKKYQHQEVKCLPSCGGSSSLCPASGTQEGRNGSLVQGDIAGVSPISFNLGVLDAIRLDGNSHRHLRRTTASRGRSSSRLSSRCGRSNSRRSQRRSRHHGVGVPNGRGRSRRVGRSGDATACSNDSRSRTSNSRPRLRDTPTAIDNGGSRDGVRGHRLVDIEQDPRVIGLVQGSSLDSGRGSASRPGHLQVDALRVVLRAVLLVARVQGDDLVTEDVKARFDVGGDLDHPSEAVGHEQIRTPPPGRRRAIYQTDLVDLEEIQGSDVGLFASCGAASGEVVDHGAVVGFRPGIPLEEDVITCCDYGMPAGVGRAPVADDVPRVEGRGLDEAVVCGFGAETDDGGRVGLVWVGKGVEVPVGDAVDDYVGYVSVGGYRDGAGEGGEEGLGGDGWHFRGMFVWLFGWDQMAGRVERYRLAERMNDSVLERKWVDEECFSQ